MSIKVYTQPVCSYCNSAKKLLESLGLEYETVQVEKIGIEEFHKQIEDYLRYKTPTKNRITRKPKIAGEESAKHERRRTNDEPSESNLPLARTNAGECSQNPS